MSRYERTTRRGHNTPGLKPAASYNQPDHWQLFLNLAYCATWRWYARTETCRSYVFNTRLSLIIYIQLVQKFNTSRLWRICGKYTGTVTEFCQSPSGFSVISINLSMLHIRISFMYHQHKPGLTTDNVDYMNTNISLSGLHDAAGLPPLWKEPSIPTGHTVR
jgi:hypothetical protein